MDSKITTIQSSEENEPLNKKYQELINKFAETNLNLNLCKRDLNLCQQFLQVLLEYDFNKIGATQVYRERIRNFLKNMKQ